MPHHGVFLEETKGGAMALFHYSHFTVVRESEKELDSIKECYSCPTFTNRKIPCHSASFINRRKSLQKNTRFVPCCSSPSTSTSSRDEVNLDATRHEQNGTSCENKRLHSGYLVRDVKWQVRRMIETQDEMRKVADIQAEAFHEPVILFDDLFFEFFKAEVLSGLLYRLRNSPPDRYACLVAQPRNAPQEQHEELAGVVDVTVQREYSVLQHLPGADEYLYVSGIAVLNKFRRQKVATTILKACDALSALWGFEYLVLRAYEDDHGARKLYSKAGYRVVSGDSPWMTTWIGRRRRVLMVKRSDSQ